MQVYLVPLGRTRFELYTETPDEGPGVPPPDGGRIRAWLHLMHERWRDAVHSARRADPDRGRFARMRDTVVSRAAETIAEQRTLWSLRQAPDATLVYPTGLDEGRASTIRLQLLGAARRHHGVWTVVDSLLFVGSGVLMIVPGPNVVAYYFLFRTIGHYLSWRGARNGLDCTVWRSRTEPALEELGRLAGEPRESRASRVEAIATGLNLPRLAAFFDRAAVPAR